MRKASSPCAVTTNLHVCEFGCLPVWRLGHQLTAIPRLGFAVRWRRRHAFAAYLCPPYLGQARLVAYTDRHTQVAPSCPIPDIANTFFLLDYLPFFFAAPFRTSSFCLSTSSFRHFRVTYEAILLVPRIQSHHNEGRNQANQKNDSPLDCFT